VLDAVFGPTNDYDKSALNPALIELNSPRIRLVLNNIEGANRGSKLPYRRLVSAAAADNVALTAVFGDNCHAQGGDGGCIYLPAGTRFSLVDTDIGYGDARTGATIFMGTGKGKQKGTYLSATTKTTKNAVFYSSAP
jgi:hypothetical protein